MTDNNHAQREFDRLKWELEQHQKEREQLFANEALLIGMLQVVSGGSLLGALAQMAPLKALAGERTFLVFVSLMVIALILAVLIALWKHDYKKWDVKARAKMTSLEGLAEAQRLSRRANRYLTLMRGGMRASVILIAVGFGVLLLASWSGSFLGVIQTTRAWVCPSGS